MLETNPIIPDDKEVAFFLREQGDVVGCVRELHSDNYEERHLDV